MNTLNMNYKPFCIKELCAEVFEVMKYQVSRRGVDLFLDIAPDIPETILSDEKRLKLILMNLISNAVKFT